MAKISKTQLKSLVKECLVELLSEGLAPGKESLNESLVATRRSPPKKKNIDRPPRPALDNVTYENQISESVNMLTDDPVMTAIFSDTAETTLQGQLQAESKGVGTSYQEQVNAHGDIAAKTVAAVDPGDIFGDAASNWATLAFSNSKPE
jgi:hypothetical protein